MLLKSQSIVLLNIQLSFDLASAPFSIEVNQKQTRENKHV